MVLVGGLFALFGSRRLADNSFLTHLATGRVIVESGLPARNPFLFSGTSFPVPSYLWSIVLGVADYLGGAVAIRLLTALLAGALGVLLVGLAQSPDYMRSVLASNCAFARSELGTHSHQVVPGSLSVAVPVVLVGLCLLGFVNPRPHLPGFVLLGLMVLVWRDRRSPLWLLPIFGVWVNTHGTWLYGLAVLGMYVIADVIDDRRLTAREFKLIGAAVVGAVIGGAVYPDHFAVMLLPTRTFGDPLERRALSMYSEWQRVGLSSPLLWMLLGIAIIAIFGCVRNRRFAAAVVAVLLVVMGMSGQRLVPIAAMALVPIATLGMEGIGTIPLPRARVAIAVTAIGAILCGAALVNSFRAPYYDFDMYPVAAVDWLEHRGLVAGEIRTVSHDYVGNYLEWRFGTRANTYVDDRPDARTFLDYGSMLSLKHGWRTALAGTHGDVIIWETGEEMTSELTKDPEWVRGPTLDDFTVFCRVDLAKRCS